MTKRLPRILCIDDEPEVLEIVSEYFADHGFAVRTAMSAEEGLREAKRWMPRVVIVDLVMPRLDGLETVERIRKINPGVLVMLISGQADVLQAMAQDIGVVATFTKPLDLPQMLAALEAVGVGRTATVRPGMATETPARTAAGETDDRLPRTVLVVDDEADIREVLAEYLRGKGFDVLQAARGEEALELAQGLCPELVLLDIRMPGLGGVETLRRLRAICPDTCVVMVSANADVETARQTLAMGAVDYLPKPIDFGYLDSVLAPLVADRIRA